MSPIIPRELQASEAFRSDVKVALALPVVALSELVDEMEARPSADSEDFRLTEVAERYRLARIHR